VQLAPGLHFATQVPLLHIWLELQRDMHVPVLHSSHGPPQVALQHLPPTQLPELQSLPVPQFPPSGVTQVVPRHVSPPLHEFPGQHTCPLAPQAMQLPALQMCPAPHPVPSGALPFGMHWAEPLAQEIVPFLH
jgi:hypothetical protein